MEVSCSKSLTVRGTPKAVSAYETAVNVGAVLVVMLMRKIPKFCSES
jgi:hypothetical protein